MRLRAQRRAGWDGRPALADVHGYRLKRGPLWQAFLAAAACYRDRRAQAHVFLIRPHAGVTQGVRIDLGR